MIRSFVSLSFIALLCGTAASQSVPLKMGLWEATVSKQANIPPAISAQLKKDGGSESFFPTETIDPPIVQKFNTCLSEASWKSWNAKIGTEKPQGCVITTFSKNSKSVVRAYKCAYPGMNTALEEKYSWLTPEKISIIKKATVSYSWIKGQAVATNRITQRCIRAGCGDVRPGPPGH